MPKDLPAFNEAHPPLMKDEDHLPSEQTARALIGTPYSLQKKFFDLVNDPKYPVQTMPRKTPKEWQKWQETLKAKQDNVDRYIVRREQFWKRVSREYFADDVLETVAYEIGMTSRHETGTTETYTQRVGAELHLNLSGDLFSPAVPGGGGGEPEPVPVALASEGGGESGGGGLGLNLTWEMSHELQFTRVDEQTYTFTRRVESQTSRKAGCWYLRWQLIERLSIARVATGSNEEVLMFETFANTPTTFTDRFRTSRADPVSPNDIAA